MRRPTTSGEGALSIELSSSAELPVRRSSRLLILDPEGRLLLFRYHDGRQPPFWATLGGELKPGEGYRDAAARELREEAGFDAEIGPILRRRDDVFAVARSEPARWLEIYFLVRCASSASPSPAGWTAEEHATIRTWRWWSLSEMTQTSEPFKPEWLSDLLATTLTDVVSRGIDSVSIESTSE